MNRKLMMKVLELLEETYPSFYHAGKLMKKSGISSLDGEFSQILRYLKETEKINIVFPESRIAPTGRYKLASWLMQIDEITITPGGIDFLTKMKNLEINEQRNKILVWSTVAIAFFAFVSLVIGLLNYIK